VLSRRGEVDSRSDEYSRGKGQPLRRPLGVQPRRGPVAGRFRVPTLIATVRKPGLRRCGLSARRSRRSANRTLVVISWARRVELTAALFGGTKHTVVESISKPGVRTRHEPSCFCPVCGRCGRGHNACWTLLPCVGQRRIGKCNFLPKVNELLDKKFLQNPVFIPACRTSIRLRRRGVD
jgi:hypothetical protein